MSATILVVDDEPDLETLVQQRFRRQIRGGEFGFRFARDGVEALDMLASDGDVDMVLSDINMPRMDGLTLLEKIQETADPLSTVIVSAYGDMANIRTAMNRGAFDFLTKPIDFADLETTIKKTLAHIARLREARRRLAEAERVHALLSRYFSPNLAERLASDPEAVDLGGQRREITSLFTDIAEFTSMVEILDLEIIAPLLNDYLGGMTEIVFANGGTVVKIIGDAMHVLFGAPADQPDHAARAVACALDLDAYAQAFRVRWLGRGIALGATRLGLSAGPAIVGNFGGGKYFDYTAYGDTVNTAARLEAANKQLGTRICVGDSVASRVPGFTGRPIGDLLLRGRKEPLRAFEPLAAAAHDDAATRAYLEAFAKLEAGDPLAMPAFAALLGLHSEDHLVGFHLRRLLNGAAGPTIALD
ncbi:MAG TPA: adenylate/guanylate cyclase domain-containing protein [Stellaceae bacterium]|jgi:adenylate cyclase|nr:adenylate/guanylate cyclase domain-containing protein [Stellaceae bacterium]